MRHPREFQGFRRIDKFMKNSLVTTIMACTLLTTHLDLCAHTSETEFNELEWMKVVTPGIYTLRYPVAQNVENEDEGNNALDPMLAGLFPKESKEQHLQASLENTHDEDLEDSEELSLLTSVEKETLYEQIYLSQLYEELQLMSDYDELMTALEAEETQKILQFQALQAQVDHDYHELMHAYSYHWEYERMVEQLAYVEMMSDYSELLDALAFQDVDPKAFDIRFGSESSADAADDKINFAALSPKDQQHLQDQMEHGELAEATRLITKQHAL